MIEHIGAQPARPGGLNLPYTPAVKAGGFVFVSGQLGIDADAKPVSAEVGAQARVCIQKMEALLKAAGTDLRHIVKVNVWITDPQDFPAFNAVYRELMPVAPPARSTVISGLVIPGTKIEIDCIAVAGA